MATKPACTSRDIYHLFNEDDAENIEDMYLRDYIYEQLDIAASARRSLAEEIRWDIEANRRS